MLLVNIPLARNASFFFDRYARLRCQPGSEAERSGADKAFDSNAIITNRNFSVVIYLASAVINLRWISTNLRRRWSKCPRSAAPRRPSSRTEERRVGKEGDRPW